MRLLILVTVLLSSTFAFSSGFDSIEIDGYTSLKLNNLTTRLEERIDDEVYEEEFSSALYNPIELGLLAFGAVDQIEKYEVHFEGSPVNESSIFGHFKRETDYTCTVLIFKSQERVMVKNCIAFGGYDQKNIDIDNFSFNELGITKKDEMIDGVGIDQKNIQNSPRSNKVNEGLQNADRSLTKESGSHSVPR